MALFTQTFTRAGQSPDLAALDTAIRVAIGDPFYRDIQTVSGVLSVSVQKSTAWNGPQTSAVQAAVDAAAPATPQTDAQNAIDAMPIIEKAIILALIDQLNVIRAALPAPLGAITPAAAIAAIRAKAATL